MGTEKQYLIRRKQPEVRIVNDEKVCYRDRLRPSEQAAIIKMNGSWLLLDEAGQEAKIRMEKLGVLWMYKGVLGLLKKLCRMMEASAEPEQYKALALRCQHLRSYVSYEKAGSDEDGTWFLKEDINTICYAVLQDTCGLCTKKGEEARKCPLQKALKSCTTLPDNRVIDGCMFKPYTDSAYYGLMDETEELTI